MDRELFVATLGVVHALFGKPAPGPAVTQALWDRVASYPDAVLPLFEQRLELAERLPANLYREFHAAREDWRSRVAARRHLFFVPCAPWRPASVRASPPPETLRARGILVMPPGYPGGPTAFDRDHALGVLWPHTGN